MDMERTRHIIAWLMAVFLAAGILFVFSSSERKPVQTLNADNNPDHFHLVATNGTVACNFTYDPLAADQWLFRTGGPWMPARP
jgi:hypothetical protein